MIRRPLLQAALFSVVSLVAALGCEQPPVRCMSARGNFAARYVPTSGPPSCADLKGETIGVQTYAAARDDGMPNYDAQFVAMRPSRLGELFARVAASSTAAGDAQAAPAMSPADAERLNALGPFLSPTPDGAGYCPLGTMSVAGAAFPRVPEQPASPDDPESSPLPEQPATDVRYTFRDARIYVTAASIGTQLSANLDLVQDGVACGYHVVALYPAVDCGADDPAHPGARVPDESLCSATADPASNRPLGSGIGPDLAVRCDPDLLLCVLTADEVPSLRAVGR
jgi:hypothetical protein